MVLYVCVVVFLIVVVVLCVIVYILGLKPFLCVKYEVVYCCIFKVLNGKFRVLFGMSVVIYCI